MSEIEFTKEQLEQIGVAPGRFVTTNGVAYAGTVAYEDAVRSLATFAKRVLAERDDLSSRFNDALNAINKACGAPGWEYPDQVVRDVESLRAERDALRECVKAADDLLSEKPLCIYCGAPRQERHWADCPVAAYESARAKVKL